MERMESSRFGVGYEEIDDQLLQADNGETGQLPRAGWDKQEQLSKNRVIRWKPSPQVLAVVALILLVTLTASWVKTMLFPGGSAQESVLTLESPSASSQNQASLPTQQAAGNSQSAVSESTAAASLWVHVTGAVKRPGLYELPAQARISQAIDQAGGVKPEADLNLINIAAPAVDGSQIYVPSQGEDPPVLSDKASTATSAASTAAAAGQETAQSDLINLNTASVQELEQLPKVGPVLAQRIVDWREENGGFKSVADLDAVSGIGPAMMQTLTPLVTV